MTRKMCHYCPFRPNSEFSKTADGWKRDWEGSELPVVAHGCSQIKGNTFHQSDPDKQCVGMQEYLRERHSRPDDVHK